MKTLKSSKISGMYHYTSWTKCVLSASSRRSTSNQKQTQEIVTGLTAMAILYSRFAPGAVYFTTGAIGASRVAKALKLCFRKPRPVGSSQKLTYGYVYKFNVLSLLTI